MTNTASTETSEPILEVWYGPEAGNMKVGPGDIPSDPWAALPWNVLAFHAGWLTIDTSSQHIEDWRKWLRMTAPGCPGLRVVSPNDAARIKAVSSMSDAEFDVLAARRGGRR
jgi:hypothetical protein